MRRQPRARWAEASAGSAILDADRVWFPARAGLSWHELPRAGGFWDRTLVEPGPLLVRDALADGRFHDQAEVRELGLLLRRRQHR